MWKHESMEDYQTPDRKMSKEFLYDVEYYEDDDFVTRERGKVNFEKLSNQDLCYILEIALGGYIEKEVYPDFGDEYFYEFFANRVDCNKFLKLLSYNLKLDKSLRKTIINTLKNHIAYIGYEDYNAHHYDAHNEHSRASQSDIDHSQVGEYVVMYKKEVSKELYELYKNMFYEDKRVKELMAKRKAQKEDNQK